MAWSQVEQPCDFKYWIDEQFEGRAKKVIQDLVSMRHNMTELYHQSASTNRRVRPLLSSPSQKSNIP